MEQPRTQAILAESASQPTLRAPLLGPTWLLGCSEQKLSSTCLGPSSAAPTPHLEQPTTYETRRSRCSVCTRLYISQSVTNFSSYRKLISGHGSTLTLR